MDGVWGANSKDIGSTVGETEEAEVDETIDETVDKPGAVNVKTYSGNAGDGDGIGVGDNEGKTAMEEAVGTSAGNTVGNIVDVI